MLQGHRMQQAAEVCNVSIEGLVSKEQFLQRATLFKKQDGAHEPECKHVRKATYVQMTLLQDTLVGHSSGTLLWDTLVGNSCGSLL